MGQTHQFRRFSVKRLVGSFSFYATCDRNGSFLEVKFSYIQTEIKIILPSFPILALSDNLIRCDKCHQCSKLTLSYTGLQKKIPKYKVSIFS